ncbi:malonyl-ACP O-methyltransferase BioC [Bacteroides pyogenes]|uniref:malonyl-ACP O-methyltransferase BioC n=1 Tax=Bacteroides pyogenes TaxID=310300 RepID=UPI001F38A22E|nr:malonyl-ACP O-methyltransferase BioC [Bacteroides pyogenes]MCF2707741.1 malonyl-ACP O-methyltransferase BioC [Bacteroides pyogenes]
MDKSLIAERFGKAAATYPREANVQRRIAGKMIGLLQTHIPSPCPEVIEFGCGTGTYSRLLFDAFRPRRLFLNDLCPKMEACCGDLLKEHRVSFLPGDAETIPFPAGTSLITSCSALQWFESPEKFFERCNALLRSRGYFAFSTFGKENMREVRTLTGNGLPYRSLEELEKALSPRFDIIHSEEEIIPLAFRGSIEVLYHLKQTGVNAPFQSNRGSIPTGQEGSGTRPWTRRDLHEFCERYDRLFRRDHSVSLTYHPIYIIAKKKE